MTCKVLRVVPSLDLGGAEHGVKRVIERLDPTEVHTKVCCLFRLGPLGGELRTAGVDVVSLDVRRHPYGLTAVRKLVSIIKQFRPDIVHTHLDAANVAGTLAARIANVPVIISNQHGAHPRRGWLIRLIDHVCALWTDRIVAVSQAAAQLHSRQCWIPLEKYYIVHSVVALEDFPFRSHRDSGDFLGPQKRLIIGNVARLSRQKGHIYLLRALPKVIAEFPDLVLLFVGDGPLREQLTQSARDLGVEEHVRFLGFRRDVVDILQCLDVFCLPSLSEGCGTAPLEAMAVGVPIVATSVGGLPEMITPEETGVLVPSADPEALAEALIDTLRHPEIAARRARAARQRVEECFSAQVAAARTMTLYDQLLSAV